MVHTETHKHTVRFWYTFPISLTLELWWPLLSITRSLLESLGFSKCILLPVLCSLTSIVSDPIFVPLKSTLRHGFFVLSHCFYLQKTLKLCLCTCSKFAVSAENLSAVLLCKAPAASYSLWWMVSFPTFCDPTAFCLCLSPVNAVFSLASYLHSQPASW